ncbi:hypothetical protein QOZ80_6AG0544780 [Eleusine coracana subsp. coracana]|nr:hypothetical protein QOZ80_6AG0544780 [Eleusine coracana subsp. coracana]
MHAAAPSRRSSGRVAAAVVVFVASFSLPLAFPFVPRAAAQELDDEGEFSYRRDAGNGPARWGVMRRDWSACAYGHMQSPIGLSDTVAALAYRPGRLARAYRPAAASLVNGGHDIMVRFNSDAGGVVIDGVAYRLRQMHWHTPSEHAVNGKRYDMELHMLHQSEATNRFAVVSQLYRIGRRRDKTISRIERYIARIARKRDHEELIDEVVDPRRPVRRSTVYYRYTGSFTTPPCTEGVTWLVAKKVRRVRKRQVSMLRNAVHDGARRNARPLQEANGRAVGFYYASPEHGQTDRATNGQVDMYAVPSSGKPAAAAVVIVILLCSGAIHRARAQQESDDERGFSYLPDAANGPSQWGSVRSDWAACAVGRLQSPIVLSAGVPGLDDGRAGRLGRSYRRAAAASLVNRGHDIMVRFYSDPGGVVIDGVAYRLRQMHWHAPSEHAIDGKGFDMELQMLHQSEATNRSAVVAQLYRISRRRRDGTIRRLERYIRRIARREDHEELIDEPVNPRRPIGGSTVYYRYTGSFTTPPCTEGVTWLVANRVRSVTRRQVRLLRNAVHDGARRNARPLQEANGRNVSFYYTSPAQNRGATTRS